MTMTPHSWMKTLALAALIAVAGCSKKEETVAAAPPPPAQPEAATPAPAAPPPAPAPAAALDPSDKLQAYIGCYNALDGRAHRALSRYASWVKNMDAGPTGNERIVYGLYPIDTNSVAECHRSMTETAAQKPALEALDAAAVAYANALQALDKTVSDAYTYYDRENYKDDNFAKGKELHPTLHSQGQAFQQASARFSHELDVENDKLLTAELARVEQTEGRKLTYWRMSLMAHAKQLANVAAEEQFDANEAIKRLATYESTTDEAMRYGAANKNELPMSWFTIENAAEEFRKAAKQRVRRVRDNVPYNEGEKMMLKPGSAWMVEGSAEQFTKAYNSLVEASNRLN